MIFYGIGVVTVSIVGAAILGVAIDELRLWLCDRRQWRAEDEQQREYRKGR